ncbi:MAG: heavy metal-responsive transcriptional regulator [Thermomicrobiales bacterium]
MNDNAAVHGHIRIGELADELGLNPKTLRYYEAIGLLPEPSRNAAGYRLYGAAHRDRLRFIAKAKALGFSLHEIADILALRDAGTEPCAHVRTLIDAKLEAVTAQLRLLEELRADLHVLQMEARGTACSCTPICSIIELHVSPHRVGGPPPLDTDPA